MEDRLGVALSRRFRRELLRSKGAFIFIIAVLFFLGGPAVIGEGRAVSSRPISFWDVDARAREMAEKPFVACPRIPEFLSGLKYDEWRDMRFDPQKALWKDQGLPFTLQFFHPGFYYDQPVKIHVVDGNGVRDVRFNSDWFNYGRNDFKDRVPSDLGFAGFRIHYPINRKDYQDEVAVLLGASYLRSLAQGQQYGMSARGLAIDTASPSGEEFPRFTEFWIFRPKPTDTQITLLALLDSPSICGAYLYTIRPGAETTIRVKSKLYARRRVRKLGIAPLSSMYFCGENSGAKCVGDFRSEVHNSDGLLAAFRSGEWLWRPLGNPRTLRIYSFDAADPVGFGLFQRDLDFDHYQDLEARYDLRPSVWVECAGRWGPGHVELIEIPTGNEFNDNIVAFWVPENPPTPGRPGSFEYTLYWSAPNANRPPGGYVASTRIGEGAFENSKKFVVDFGGDALESLPADKPIAAVVSIDDRRHLLEQQLYKNRVTGGWRLVLQIQMDKPGSLSSFLPDGHDVTELRAFLKDDRNTLTETWSYAYEP